MARSRKTTSNKGKKDSSQSTLKTAFPASTSPEAADQVPPVDKEPEVKSPSAAAPADGNLNQTAAHSTAALRPTIQHSRYVNIDKGLNSRRVLDPTIRPVMMDNSDVEVSEETIVAMDPTSMVMAVHLRLAGSLVNVCAHRLRRYMFGNDRLPLLFLIDNNSGIRKIIERWYHTALGRHFELLHGGVRRVDRIPYVDRSALYFCSGVFIFCPSSEAGCRGTLRFIHAPVDYAHRGYTGALYGIRGTQASVTRTLDFSLKDYWKDARCHRIWFTNGHTHNPTEGK